MANDRDSVQSLVESYVGRAMGSDTTIIPNMINLASRMMGVSISNVYDVQRWQHTITQADSDNRVNNWKLPSVTKFVKTCNLVDTTNTEERISPLYKVSQQEWYRIESPDLAVPTRNYNVNKPTFRDVVGRGARFGRVDNKGIPQYYTRIGDNIFIHPFPDDSTVGWQVLVLLAIRPAPLTTGGTQNSLTLNYEEILALVASALLLALNLNDPIRARNFLNSASGMLNSIADEQEISILRDSVINLKP